MGMLEMSQLLITKAFWGKCIDLFVRWVGNYGWAIILLTIAIKLILLPVEIMQKRVNAKNAKMQAIMQPELQKVQQQFPGDRAKLNQKQMELAKKYNFNMTGTCVVLLVSLVLTLVVFTSLFTGLNALSKKQENVAFNEIYQTYTQAVDYTETNVSQFETDGNLDQTKVDAYVSNQVNAKFKEQSKKYSFMWVKNVWKGDTTTSPVVKYSSFKDYALKNGIVQTLLFVVFFVLFMALYMGFMFTLMDLEASMPNGELDLEQLVAMLKGSIDQLALKMQYDHTDYVLAGTLVATNFGSWIVNLVVTLLEFAFLGAFFFVELCSTPRKKLSFLTSKRGNDMVTSPELERQKVKVQRNAGYTSRSVTSAAFSSMN